MKTGVYNMQLIQRRAGFAKWIENKCFSNERLLIVNEACLSQERDITKLNCLNL